MSASLMPTPKPASPDALAWAQAHNHCRDIACADLTSPHCECALLAAGLAMLDHLGAAQIAVLAQHKEEWVTPLAQLVADLAIDAPELELDYARCRAIRRVLHGAGLLIYAHAWNEDTGLPCGSGYTLTELGMATLWAHELQGFDGAISIARFIRAVMQVQP